LTIDVVFMPQAGITASMKEDAYRRKALRTFFKFGRVEAIPAQLKKFLIILERLAEEFEPGPGTPSARSTRRSSSSAMTWRCCGAVSSMPVCWNGRTAYTGGWWTPKRKRRLLLDGANSGRIAGRSYTRRFR